MSKLAKAGLVVAALTVVVPILWPVALVLGILVLVRTKHHAAGALILVLGVVVLPLAGSVVWMAAVVRTYRVPSESMVPTLRVGERIAVLKLGYSPKVGDIAVFAPPAGVDDPEGQCGEDTPDERMCAVPAPGKAEYLFIKRVVAGPGDRIRMEKGRLIRNGRPESFTGARPCGGGPGCDFPQEIEVPPGHYFMLGDNRGASDDSRFWGPVPEEHFVGRRWFTYYGG